MVSRKVVFGLAISVIALISTALVIISPAFIDDLGSINSVETLNWSRLSEIGQTYGVAAAILSTLAFAGIAASLIMQADQTRSSRLHAVRVYHLELLKMATEKPELYLPVLGVHTEVDLDEARQRIYAVSQMNYFLMAYENRIVHEKSLRGEMLTDAFQSELVRDWWKIARHAWLLGTRDTRRERKFFKIVDSEYEKAIAQGPPPITRQHAARKQESEAKRKAILTASDGILIGICLGWTAYAIRNLRK